MKYLAVIFIVLLASSVYAENVTVESIALQPTVSVQSKMISPTQSIQTQAIKDDIPQDGIIEYLQYAIGMKKYRSPGGDHKAKMIRSGNSIVLDTGTIDASARVTDDSIGRVVESSTVDGYIIIPSIDYNRNGPINLVIESGTTTYVIRRR